MVKKITNFFIFSLHWFKYAPIVSFVKDFVKMKISSFAFQRKNMFRRWNKVLKKDQLKLPMSGAFIEFNKLEISIPRRMLEVISFQDIFF